MLNLFFFQLLACGDQQESTSEMNSSSVSCENNICILSGTITEDLTLTSDNIYLLRGGVFIGDDINETILDIEAGTTIYGENSTDGMLIVRRGSKIFAEGTVENPIVFTSSKEPGSRSRGDWGGIVINGRAPINACAEADVACEAFGEGGTGFYGGNDPTDSSGVLNYVRVEFAGTLISPENELNGIALQGVGSETVIDYIQVHMNADDGVEFFGGTAVAKHLLVTGAGDDALDWTDGWTGGAQYVVLHQYEDNSDNGIEADNNGENNNAEPRSNPSLANFTLIGAPTSDASDYGVLLREGTAAQMINFLVVGFNDACLNVDNDSTFTQLESGSITMTNSNLNCDVNFEIQEEVDLEAWFLAQDGNAVGGAEVAEAYNTDAPSYETTKASEAIAGDAGTLHTSFEAAEFIGAVGSEDWTIGWTTHEQN